MHARLFHHCRATFCLRAAVVTGLSALIFSVITISNCSRTPSNKHSSDHPAPVISLYVDRTYDPMTEDQVRSLNKAETLARLKWIARERDLTRGGQVSAERQREFQLLLDHLKSLQDE